MMRKLYLTLMMCTVCVCMTFSATAHELSPQKGFISDDNYKCIATYEKITDKELLLERAVSQENSMLPTQLKNIAISGDLVIDGVKQKGTPLYTIELLATYVNKSDPMKTLNDYAITLISPIATTADSDFINHTMQTVERGDGEVFLYSTLHYRTGDIWDARNNQYTPTIQAIGASTSASVRVSGMTVESVAAKVSWRGFDTLTTQPVKDDSGWRAEWGTYVYQAADGAPCLDVLAWEIQSYALAHVKRGNQSWEMKHGVYFNAVPDFF